MILLDNQIYVLAACNRLEITPTYRTIPLAISCFAGQSLLITSILNIIFIFIGLFLLFQIFSLNKKQSLIAASIFSLNSYVAFPFFYSAAHSYVYTILSSIVALTYIHHFENLTLLKKVLALLLSNFMLCFVRSESIYYFGFSVIAYTIFYYIYYPSFEKFKHTIKMKLMPILSILIVVFLSKYIIEFFSVETVLPNKNLANSRYALQYPQESFFALEIWAVFEYFKAFISPLSLSFFGNYSDWLTIHESKTTQIILYGVTTALIGFSLYAIMRKKRSVLNYVFIGCSIFIIPSLLISFFLRNQWYYPSRGLIGCTLSLPFFVFAFMSIKSIQLKKLFLTAISVINISTFFIHIFFHFKDESSMYLYENGLLGKNHPYTAKQYSQQLKISGRLDLAKSLLVEAERNLPKRGCTLSANHFYVWAQNLYLSAEISYFQKDLIEEQRVLKELYSFHNYYGALACLQDDNIPIETCLKPELKRFLCNPTYHQLFKNPYYKRPKQTVEQVCYKNQ